MHLQPFTTFARASFILNGFFHVRLAGQVVGVQPGRAVFLIIRFLAGKLKISIMSELFRVERNASRLLLSEIAASNPANPFYTPQYIDARSSQGAAPLILISDHGQPRIYCPAFMKTGRLRCSLEIPSMPGVRGKEPFWQGLMAFCRQQGVSDLSVNSFGSQGGAIPQLNHEKSRKSRWEYVLDLKHPDTLKKMRKGHAYSVKRARKLGLKIRRARDLEAVEAHARLIGVSMQRRKNRGENVTTSVVTNDLLRLIQSGAGEIFQAVLPNAVVSSNFILLADKAGYNHTQGASPEGMDCGAAHFLIHEIACILRDEGKEQFNLGGTDDPDPDSGLVKFKTGFGAATLKNELEAARFEVGGVAERLLRRILIIGTNRFAVT